MPEAPPGYTHFSTVQIDELCGYLYGSNNPLNEYWRNELGVDHGSATGGLCAIISIAAAAGTLGTGGVVVGTACSAAYLGCAINDAIRENTSCNSQYVDIYSPSKERIEKAPTGSPPSLLVTVRCDGGFDVNPEDLAGDIRKSLESAADAVSDVGSDIIDDIGNAFDEFGVLGGNVREEINGAVPQDIDNDGNYMDINANGRIDSDDVATYFRHKDNDAISNHVSAYDYNGNNRIDFDDVTVLLKKI